MSASPEEPTDRNLSRSGGSPEDVAAGLPLGPPAWTGRAEASASPADALAEDSPESPVRPSAESDLESDLEPNLKPALDPDSVEDSESWERELKREIERLRSEITELRESKTQLLSQLRDAERSRALDDEEALKFWGSALEADDESISSRASASVSQAGTLSYGGANGKAGGLGSGTNSSDLPVGTRLHPKRTVSSPTSRTSPTIEKSQAPADGHSVASIDRTLAAAAAVVLGIALGLTGGALWGKGPAPGGTSQSVAKANPSAETRAEAEDPDSAEAQADDVVDDVQGGMASGTISASSNSFGGLTEASARRSPMQASFASGAASLNGSPATEAPGTEPLVGPPQGDEGTAPPPESGQTKSEWTLPVYLADLAPGAFTLKQGAQAPPCAYAEQLMDPERRAELLPALGPCIGAHGSAGTAVGTHRVAGVDCCAHHAFVERMTGASSDPAALEGILEESRVALRDGQVPPLLRLRAERSALQFLRRLAGSWSSAGIDDGSMGHRWTASNSDPTRLRMSSWISLDEEGASYPFEMEIELSDGPRGDLLVAFDWLGTDPLGVAIVNAADPSSGPSPREGK